MSAGTMTPAKAKHGLTDSEGQPRFQDQPRSAQPIAPPVPPAPPVAAPPPKKVVDAQRRSVMQEHLPRISTRMSKGEAHEARRTWKSPQFMGGTAVFFRPDKSDREFPGTLMRESNGTWSVQAQITGQGFVEKLSCRWYDHELENAVDVCDPLAAHNSNGTFRLTPFSMMVTELYNELMKNSG